MFLILITTLLAACKHEVPEPRTFGHIETIINRGNILDLGISQSQVCFLNSKPEIGVLNRQTGEFHFFNAFNANLSDVSDIQGVGDTLVLGADFNNGMFAFGADQLVSKNATLDNDGFDFSYNPCFANSFGVFVDVKGQQKKLPNSFRFGMTLLSSLAASDDTCWVGTRGYGLFHIDLKVKQPKQLAPRYLGNHKVKQVFFDVYKNLWVVTEAGISVRRNGVWKVHRSPTWLKINHLALHGADVYLATNLGLYRLDQSSSEFRAIDEGKRSVALSGGQRS